MQQLIPDAHTRTCPSCHTVHGTTADAAVIAGADWQCARCGQQWNAVRLATVAAYAAWLSTRASTTSQA